MKQITLDFETYQKELKSAYERGHKDSKDLVPGAITILRNIMDQKFDRRDVILWLRDATEKYENPEGTTSDE